jgi:hypothetical protein
MAYGSGGGATSAGRADTRMKYARAGGGWPPPPRATSSDPSLPPLGSAWVLSLGEAGRNIAFASALCGCCENQGPGPTTAPSCCVTTAPAGRAPLSRDVRMHAGAGPGEWRSRMTVMVGHLGGCKVRRRLSQPRSVKRLLVRYELAAP